MRRRLSRVGHLLVVTILCQAVAQADLSEGLVAYYPFDDGAGETLSESTGAGTDGELFNFDFEDESNWVDGQIGGALEYDGIDDYVIAPEYTLADTGLSVSIWAYADTAPTWASLVKNWGGANVGQFHFGLGPGASATLNIFVTDDTGFAFNAGTDVEEFPLEDWVHAAFVADPATETVTQYLNGEMVSEEFYDGTFTSAPNSSALGIGVKTNDAGDFSDDGVPAFWDGKLDDLGLWLRALTEEEITQIYTNGLAGKPILGAGGLVGDFNENGALDAPDIDDLTAQSAGGTNPTPYDLNSDSLVNDVDVAVWIRDLFGSWVGDANLDGQFNSSDLVDVLASGTYESGANSVWSSGDFNGDGLTTSSDLVAALADGGYEKGTRPATAAVPEPTSIVLFGFALWGLCWTRRCR